MTRLSLIALAAFLSGCALIAREQTIVTESLLERAGFQTRALGADDADLPPRDFVTQSDGDQTVYVYADPEGCECVYSGSRAQYERYRWLEARENVLRELNGAAMNAASLDDNP
jgi:hypothetical protein